MQYFNTAFRDTFNMFAFGNVTHKPNLDIQLFID